jgi:hypothetical protein
MSKILLPIDEDTAMSPSPWRVTMTELESTKQTNTREEERPPQASDWFRDASALRFHEQDFSLDEFTGLRLMCKTRHSMHWSLH